MEMGKFYFCNFVDQPAATASQPSLPSAVLTKRVCMFVRKGWNLPDLALPWDKQEEGFSVWSEKLLYDLSRSCLCHKSIPNACSSLYPCFSLAALIYSSTENRHCTVRKDCWVLDYLRLVPELWLNGVQSRRALSWQSAGLLPLVGM